MNEDERSSQVSALFDGELAAGQSDLLVRRMLKDPGLRATWGRYALIGASLRHEPLAVAAPGHDDLATRVAAALAAEPELAGASIAAGPASRDWVATVYKGLWGSALAAAVAAVSILVLRTQAVPGGGQAMSMARNQAVESAPVRGPVVAAPPSVAAPAVRGELVADAGAAPSYTTPTVVNGGSTALPAPLINYVVAHSEYLTPVMRFNPLSAVMMGGFEGDELVEATEAEIGAARR
jgi:negative regulator of sigma E activity